MVGPRRVDPPYGSFVLEYRLSRLGGTPEALRRACGLQSLTPFEDSWRVTPTTVFGYSVYYGPFIPRGPLD